MDKISLKDFTDICRFCLMQSNELKIISEIPSVEILLRIIGIENADILPQKMCLSCTNIFETFLAFTEESRNNIERLLALYKEAHTEYKCNNSDNEEFDNNSENNHIDENIIKEENESIQKESYVLRSRKDNKKYLDLKTCHEEPAGLYKCERCRKKFPAEELLSEHIRTKECIYVKSTKNSRKCNKSSKKGKLIPKIMCKICKLTFTAKAELTVHCRDVTCQPMDYKCSVCNKFFKKQYRLNSHMRSHTKEAPFECTQCQKAFRFQQNLKRHILIHKGIKKFKCDDCGKEFSRAHVLNEHRNIHTGHNPYICDYCGRGFKRYANHFIHVYRHKLLNGEVDQTEDQKLYLQLQCNICNKVFASRGGLDNHMPLHQDEPREKRFLCTECGKGFVTNGQLESHMRIHTGDRPFQCTQCGKRFKQKSSYSNHKSVHSGEKPYQCKLCERFFTQSGHLKIHMRVHSGEKPFACNFCGRKFALKSNLKVHTRTHTGEKPYVCSVCNKGYYDSTSLKKHMKSHGVGLPSHGHIESESGIIYYTNTDQDNEQVTSKT